MDRSSSDQACEDSYSLHPRSRAASGVSATEGLFSDLRLLDSPRSLAFDPSRPSSSRGLAPSPAYISPLLPHSSPYLPTPVSQSSHSPFPPLPDDVLDSGWFDINSHPQGTPLLRVDPAEDNIPASPQPTASESASMSAVATLHFDPVFSMGSRSSFTWPVIDSHNSLLGHDLSSYATSDASISPSVVSRSDSASPPRGALSPEQRELKRQRDQARRDSKAAVRIRRAGSNGSFVQSPPVTMADLAASQAIPVYATSAPSQVSILTDPVTTLAPSPYLPSYSPALSDQSQPIFPGAYQPSYLTDYPSSYPTTSAPSLLPHYGRPTMPVGQDPSVLYPMPPVMGHGAGGPVGDNGVRVVQTRPKPQCWEHGCNGRQFSTFSNLLRHQREKSGQAAKVACPNCGAEFTRTTARNGHLLHDKCKQRRST